MSPFVEGVRDLLPGEIRERRWVYQELREYLARDGYQEVATPTLESLDLYTGIETILGQEQMLKVVDENGQILVLRPDLTMPIARLVATRYHKTPGPWKFSYIGTAYQANRGQSHLLREKTQAGVELLGRADRLAEVEVIGLLIGALQQVGITEPMIDLGQAALVEEVFSSLTLSEQQKAELRILMEGKNSQEIQQRLQEWEIDPTERELISQFPRSFGQPEEVLVQLRQLPLTPKALQIVTELEEIYQALQAIGLGSYITFDPAMVTQMGYYTGTIFRAYVRGYGEVVASGGRYDGLAERFGSDVPAVGFAIEIERLLQCLRQSEEVPTQDSNRLVIQVAEASEFVPSYRLAELLKEQGIAAELFYGNEVGGAAGKPDLTAYCQFHQIPQLACWDGDTLQLTDLSTAQQVQFFGNLTELAEECQRFSQRRGE